MHPINILKLLLVAMVVGIILGILLTNHIKSRPGYEARQWDTGNLKEGMING